MSSHSLHVALAQISPIWLDKNKTIKKICSYISDAAKEGAELIVFGEALLPGYPFWLSLTDGAKFESRVQKELHAHYLHNAVQIEKGDLNDICDLAKKNKISIYIGTVERAINRANHSLYCSLVFINKTGVIKSIHRKLQPTYEERLCWAIGDGNGLDVHNIKEFKLGGLNCWENWMPLSRTALYAQGENLHVAVWPGSESNTKDITRFIAKESRSFVLSVSSLMRKSDIGHAIPHSELILKGAPDTLANGGSCIAGPDGNWIIPPVLDKEELLFAQLDINRVYEERQNFDPSGHYSRPDVTKLSLDKTRQSIIDIKINDEL